MSTGVLAVTACTKGWKALLTRARKRELSRYGRDNFPVECFFG